MSEFYLTLPSNTATGSEANRTNRFRVELPHTIELEGDWDVALVDIVYPHSWDNVNSVGLGVTHVAALLVITNGTDDNHKLYLPNGYYETINDLNFAIIQAWNDKQKEIGQKASLPPFHFKFNQITKRNRLVYAEKQDKVITVRLSKHLQYLMGYDRDYIAHTSRHKEAKYPPDMRGGIDALYVYCDIVENQIIGDSLEPLLRIVPVQGKHGDLVEKNFEMPHYVPLLNKKFSSVEVHIKTDTDTYLPFNYGKVIVKLQFRKRSKNFLQP